MDETINIVSMTYFNLSNQSVVNQPVYLGRHQLFLPLLN